MKRDRRVQGIIRDDQGAAQPGVLLEMISTGRRLRWQYPVLLAESDWNGRYMIDGIPPGEYYLGVNIMHSPTRENPYPPTYYPDTTEVSQAIPIPVLSGASIQEFDLRVPGKLPLLVLEGRAVTVDGKPPREQDRPQVRIKDPGLSGQIERRPIEIDAEGRFRIKLCEGIRYSAFAFIGGSSFGTYSAPVEFIPTTENNRLELVLDKTSEEFHKLRARMQE